MTIGTILLKKLTQKEDLNKERKFFNELMKDIRKIPLDKWNYSLKSEEYHEDYGDGFTTYEEQASASLKTGALLLLSEGDAWAFWRGFSQKQTYENVRDRKYSLIFSYGNQLGEDYEFGKEFFKNNRSAKKRVSKLRKKLYKEYQGKIAEERANAETINLKKRSLDKLEKVLSE